MYMAYMVAGVFFIILCGFDLAYTELWLHTDLEPEPEGHPVKFNRSGALIPVVLAHQAHHQQRLTAFFLDRLLHGAI